MRSFYVYVLALFFVCSCSSRNPYPVNYQYSQQRIMQASAHWQDLAADLAKRINNQLIVTDNTHQAVFVKETCGDESSPCKPGETSSFNEAFHDLLITNLYEYGVPTKSQPDENAIEISYKVQLVHYSTDRAASNYEVIITSSMITRGRIFFRASDIYYINEKDFFNYQDNIPQTKTIKLTNGETPVPFDINDLLPESIATIYKIDSDTIPVLKTDV